ncbi:class I SAM-dependent DNA methyltransferase [Ornithinibacillus scapharcae]|uniref:class I SAM-dependent DNA methyltransferase n=1 Tax=Ornithinibacillus scapharcae TaxID=1147159 RepID=UPI000225AA58|nr:class I SAM-dependent methyltransferase [Ornithinibacillus scapharcae]
MGREFLDIFEGWAEEYDNTVSGYDPEYKEVFHAYDDILVEVAKNSEGNILEFGVGTGNLTEKLLERGHDIIGIEPSPAMKAIANAKLPEALVMDGDFLEYPIPTIPIHTIVSTYAFHHLTDDEKDNAVKKFADILEVNGKVVFADTMFETLEAKEKKTSEAEEIGFTNLAADLRREYYPTMETIEGIFTKHNFTVSFKQMNEFVWLIIAKKE